jgi:hypothetical protein
MNRSWESMLFLLSWGSAQPVYGKANRNRSALLSDVF